MKTITTQTPQHADPRLDGSNLTLFLAFGLCILGIVGIALWSVRLEFNETRSELLQSEVNRLRSHAIRTALRIQENFDQAIARGEDVWELEPSWLRKLWERSLKSDESHLYGALIDPTGDIVYHSNATLESNSLSPSWYARQIPEAGDDVVETQEADLTGGPTALDVSIPIVHGSQQIAIYHSGISVPWFDEQLSRRLAPIRQRWVITTALIIGIVGLACYAATSVARRVSALHSAIADGRVRQLAELGQVAGGIAHEIRNPLNAVRMNLHVIERAWIAHAPEDEDSTQIVAETIQEIEQVDVLLRSLLEYAKPEKAQAELVDVGAEVCSVLTFMGPSLEHDDIKLTANMPSTPLHAYIDRLRLRRLVMNLLCNAVEAAGPNGKICVAVGSNGANAVEMVVSDTGSGVPAAQREAIFQPFYSTKELGTGLGLTLVKRFVEEAHGEITCGEGKDGGAEFRVTLPASSVPVHEKSTNNAAAIAMATQVLGLPLFMSLS